MDRCCITCGGDLIFLGILGNRTHCRCRNCGMDQHHETIEEDREFAREANGEPNDEDEDLDEDEDEDEDD